MKILAFAKGLFATKAAVITTSLFLVVGVGTAAVLVYKNNQEKGKVVTVTKSNSSKKSKKEEAQKDITPPTVSGVEEGKEYISAVKITFDANEVTFAKLNGSDYVSDTEINTNGDYSIVVSDKSGNATSIKFKLNIPSPVVAVPTPKSIPASTSTPISTSVPISVPISVPKSTPTPSNPAESSTLAIPSTPLTIHTHYGGGGQKILVIDSIQYTFICNNDYTNFHLEVTLNGHKTNGLVAPPDDPLLVMYKLYGSNNNVVSGSSFVIKDVAVGESFQVKKSIPLGGADSFRLEIEE